MEVDGDPGGQGPVDVGQVSLEPDVLLAAHGVVDVVAEEDVVGGPHVHRVEEVGRRAARPVRRLRSNTKSRSFTQSVASCYTWPLAKLST